MAAITGIAPNHLFLMTACRRHSRLRLGVDDIRRADVICRRRRFRGMEAAGVFRRYRLFVPCRPVSAAPITAVGSLSAMPISRAAGRVADMSTRLFRRLPPLRYEHRSRALILNGNRLC